MQGNKKAFTLVELLVAMAIIAILLGLSVVGITIVQQNARDTQRRAKVSDMEIAITGQLVSQQNLPYSFKTAVNLANTETAVYVSPNLTIQLTGSLRREKNGAEFTMDTNSSRTDYCYNIEGNLYVIGVALEGGSFFFKTNSGYTYNSFDSYPIGGSMFCYDDRL